MDLYSSHFPASTTPPGCRSQRTPAPRAETPRVWLSTLGARHSFRAAVWETGVRAASLVAAWEEANSAMPTHQTCSLLAEHKCIAITRDAPEASNAGSPSQRDSLGRQVAVSVRALRAPGLALQPRHGLGNFALVVFSTAVHALDWVGGEKEGKEETEMREAEGGCSPTSHVSRGTCPLCPWASRQSLGDEIGNTQFSNPT